MPALRLAEILAARLCHDLSSPLGALDNTLELAITTAGSPDGDEALAIARETARALSQRLRLLRAAWAADPGPLDGATIEALASGLPNRHRLTFDFSRLDPAPAFAPLAGRVVLNMVLLAGAALPMGGTIAVSGAATRQVAITIAGPRAAWPAGLANRLKDPGADAATLEPDALPGALTALLAATAGLPLRLLAVTGADAGPGADPEYLLLSLS